MTRLFDGVPFPAGRKEWGRKYHWKSQKYSFRIGGLNPVRRAGFWNWAGSQEVPCQIFTFQIICDTLNLLFKYKHCVHYIASRIPLATILKASRAIGISWVLVIEINTLEYCYLTKLLNNQQHLHVHILKKKTLSWL